MARLSLSLLGTFQVNLDGEPVTAFESDKVRALLAYLVLESKHPHRRETLVGLLWPERPERVARQNLSQALSNLRRVVGDRAATPPFILSSRQTLQFNPSSDHRLDVTVFSGLLDACKRHRHRRITACDACIDRLEQATTLFRGSFLKGFSLGDCPGFEEWSLLEGERLHHLVLEALRHLADCYERRGAYGAALHYARRLVELDPWREAAQRQLMRVLALSGQRNAALGQHEACRCLLETELGVVPEEETRTLYELIRNGVDISAVSSTPPHNLPVPTTPFIGREMELAALKECLGDPNCRLLTLVGPGGSGKTRLALEAAGNQIYSFDHGVFFVSLAPLVSAQAIIPTLAQALGFTFYKEEDPKKQLLDYLHQKRLLLIMDNFEHLLPSPVLPPEGATAGEASEGVELVTDILNTAPGITILATSRARLNVQAEQLFSVTGMRFPKLTSQMSADLTDYSAVRLFLTNARRARRDFEPTSEALQDIACICRLVDGMPLGVVLAAAWVKILTPAEIALQIGRSLDFLTTDLRDLPARQRSMRAVFDHTWRLLTERERKVFRQLSVFRGGFTPDAARQVTGASLRELMSLIDRSLLDCLPNRRYEIHELLRQYAAEKLETSGKSHTARNAHCAFYAAALQSWEADLRGSRQRTAVVQLGADIENARAAWNWAVEQQHTKQLEQAIDGLCLFYEWGGHYQEGKVACQIAAKQLTATTAGNTQPPVAQSSEGVLAKILAWQGAFHHRLGDKAVAGQLLKQSLALLEQQAVRSQAARPERAFCLLQMGHVVSDSNREHAGQLYKQSLTLFEELGDSWAAATALFSLGEIAENLGAFGEAEQLIKESLILRQTLGDHKGSASSLSLLGSIARSQGQLEEAEHLLQEGLAIHNQVDDQVGTAQVLVDLGVVYLILGRLAKADSLLEESVAIYNDLGIRSKLAYARTRLGLAKALSGQYEQARAQECAALSLARETSYATGIGFSLLVLGMVALAEEKHPEAQRILQESAVAFQEIGQRDDPSTVFALLGYAECGLGDTRRAGAYLSDALRTATGIRAFAPLIFGLTGTALLLANHCDPERAVELYTLSRSRFPTVECSRWFEDVVGKHIAAVAATLPPDIVAAAQARARAQDLWTTAEKLVAELRR